MPYSYIVCLHAAVSFDSFASCNIHILHDIYSFPSMSSKDSTTDIRFLGSCIATGSFHSPRHVCVWPSPLVSLKLIEALGVSDLYNWPYCAGKLTQFTLRYIVLQLTLSKRGCIRHKIGFTYNITTIELKILSTH